MKKKKSIHLDSYEKEINDAIERGQVHEFSPGVLHRMRVKYAQAASYTKELTRKDRRVSLRMNEKDLDFIQGQSRGQRFALSDAHRHDSSPSSYGQSHGYAVVSDFTFSAVAIQLFRR